MGRVGPCSLVFRVCGSPSQMDRVCAVFGGSRGIGRAVARLMAQRDYRLAIVARNLQGARAVAGDLGGGYRPEAPHLRAASVDRGRCGSEKPSWAPSSPGRSGSPCGAPGRRCGAVWRGFPARLRVLARWYVCACAGSAGPRRSPPLQSWLYPVCFPVSKALTSLRCFGDHRQGTMRFVPPDSLLLHLNSIFPPFIRNGLSVALRISVSGG